MIKRMKRNEREMIDNKKRGESGEKFKGKDRNKTKKKKEKK